MVRLVNDRGAPIRGLNDWTKPKKEHQWRASYSAMELTKAWCEAAEPTCPVELRALLDSHPLTRSAVLMEGAPEHVTVLPVRGEGRNHDLWLLGEVNGSKLTICVEAKVEEPFGECIGAYIQKSRQGNERSEVPARAQELLRIVLGKDTDPEQDPIASLRYQLLTAMAGTVLQAQNDGALLALLVVHEFKRQRPKNPLSVQTNAADLDAFLTNLAGTSTVAEPGKVLGPWLMGGSVANDQSVQVLVGKITTTLPG